MTPDYESGRAVLVKYNLPVRTVRRYWQRLSQLNLPG